MKKALTTNVYEHISVGVTVHMTSKLFNQFGRNCIKDYA